MAERPAGRRGPLDGPADDRDWFGFPLDRPRQPVPCPRCGAAFTDRDAYAAHLTEVHGVRGTGRAPGPSGDRPALGRNRRTPLARRLRTLPLVLVLLANVALIVAVLGAMAAIGPPWWDELMAQPWGQAVVIPLLWPTVLFLALRGVD